MNDNSSLLEIKILVSVDECGKHYCHPYRVNYYEDGQIAREWIATQERRNRRVTMIKAYVEMPIIKTVEGQEVDVKIR